MNVRRAQFEGVHDDLVHQPDERRVRIDRAAVVINLDRFDFALRQFLDHVLEAAVLHSLFLRAAVILVQRGFNVLLRRHFRVNFRAQQMRQRINRVDVRRIGDGDDDLVFGFENRNDAVFFCDVARDDGDDFVLDSHSAKLDDFRAELRRLGLRHVRRADDFVGDKKIHHAHAGSLSLGARGSNLLGGHKAEVHQQVQKIIVFFSHDSKPPANPHAAVQKDYN
jgi:hypothetical protein